MSKKSLGAVTVSYPLPVYLVGTYDSNGRPNIMTAAWGGICSSIPPCLAVSIRPERHTHAALLERKAFTVSIPGAPLAAQADYCGMESGRKADKFERLGLTPVKSELVDAPYVGECPIVIELSLHTTVELGSHTQFIGKIEDVKASPEFLDEHGNPDYIKMQALIYSSKPSAYLAAGSVVGKAFSMGKEFLKK